MFEYKDVKEAGEDTANVVRHFIRFIVSKTFHIEYAEDRTTVFRVKKGKKTGPYCTRCWEVDHRLVTVSSYKNARQEIYICPQCHNKKITELNEKRMNHSTRHSHLGEGDRIEPI